MPNSEKVVEIFKDCLYRDDEIIDGKPIVEFVAVEGITSKFGLHPDRLKSHKEEIKAMLSEFSDTFMKDGGGGHTFLSFCETKSGELWTGLHNIMENLMCLGIGCGFVEYCMPRELWSALPGGMPYFTIDLNKGE